MSQKVLQPLTLEEFHKGGPTLGLLATEEQITAAQKEWDARFELSRPHWELEASILAPLSLAICDEVSAFPSEEQLRRMVITLTQHALSPSDDFEADEKDDKDDKNDKGRPTNSIQTEAILYLDVRSTMKEKQVGTDLACQAVFRRNKHGRHKWESLKSSYKYYRTQLAKKCLPPGTLVERGKVRLPGCDWSSLDEEVEAALNDLNRAQ
jgi:hypothetical protein